MDLNFLHSTLKIKLDKFHLARNIRYRNIGFSSKKLNDLDDVTQTLRSLLPSYALWQQPNVQSAPAQIISRKDFQDNILSANHDGIIIQQPEQWLSQWSLLDKQAFWSAISMWHGTTKLVLSFAESDEFQQINNAYYKPQVLDGLAINFWRPAHAE